MYLLYARCCMVWLFAYLLGRVAVVRWRSQWETFSETKKRLLKLIIANWHCFRTTSFKFLREKEEQDTYVSPEHSPPSPPSHHSHHSHHSPPHSHHDIFDMAAADPSEYSHHSVSQLIDACKFAPQSPHHKTRSLEPQLTSHAADSPPRHHTFSSFKSFLRVCSHRKGSFKCTMIFLLSGEGGSVFIFLKAPL